MSDSTPVSDALRHLLAGVEAAHESHRSGRLGPTGVSALLTDIEHSLRAALSGDAESGLDVVPAATAVEILEVVISELRLNGYADWPLMLERDVLPALTARQP